MQQPVGSSGNGISLGSLLLVGLFVLFLAFYLVLGLIFVTIATWPWCLLVLPAVGGIVIAVRPRFRSNLIHAFREAASDPEALELRHALIVTSLIATAAVGCLCAFFVGGDAVQWWLIP